MPARVHSQQGLQPLLERFFNRLPVSRGCDAQKLARAKAGGGRRAFRVLQMALVWHGGAIISWAITGLLPLTR
jgi:hypothetical protein